MISEQQHEQASLYALGALSEVEARAFESELRGNMELTKLVRTLQRVSDLLATSRPVPPRPSLKQEVLGRIDAATTAAKPAPNPLAGLSFLHGAAQKDWKPLPIPGAYIKMLSFEKERGYAICMGKLDPGAAYPEHINAGPEDILILSGDLVIGDRKMVAGDFHHAAKGSLHQVNYSVEGCTLIAVLTTDDPLVAFALA